MAIKQLLLVLTMVAALSTPLLARQWSSRAGGFSVEAELIDVRDGNAILKKADGTELSVALNKLSLADVRYVEETLKAADARLAGKVDAPEPQAEAREEAEEEMQDEAQDEPQGESPASKAASKSLGSQKYGKLRYAWKPGQSYIYRTSITIDHGNSATELTGDFTYKVNAATDDGFEMQVTGSLHSANPAPPSPTVIVLGRHYRHLASSGSSPDVYMATITVDQHGRIVRIHDDRQLPNLLGGHASMILEPLPSPRRARWTDTGEAGGAVVVTLEPLGRFLPTARRESGEGIDATEKTSYTVEKGEDKLITVAKHYELTSSSMVAGQPKIEATGDGKWRFDVQRGVPSSLDYSLRVTTRDRNTTEVTPVRFSYRLLSEEEQARMAKDLEEAKQKYAKAQEEQQRPLTDAEVAKMLEELKSGDRLRISRATWSLAERSPSPKDAKLVPALEAIVQLSEDDSSREHALKCLKTRSRPESAATVAKALGDDSFMVRNTALEMIPQFAPEKHIPAIATLLGDHLCQENAAKVLRAIGPAAEDAVLVYMDSSDQMVRRKVCELLGQIGTKKSLPVLEKIVGNSDSSNSLARHEAERAVNAIKVRSQLGSKRK